MHGLLTESMGDESLDFYNRLIGYRWNCFIRNNFINKKKRKKLINNEITILCNNCTGGLVLHDLGLRFNTPTINLFFYETDFFDFIEHLEYYVEQELIENIPSKFAESKEYPIGILPGGSKYKDLELHFLHYKSFAEAKEKWENRKRRINWNNIYVIWTFMGSMGQMGNESYYERAQNLPIKNKVIFVNHPVDKNLYPSFYYIKGFEKQDGLGVISLFKNFKGERYYDQFDFVKWLNEKET